MRTMRVARRAIRWVHGHGFAIALLMLGVVLTLGIAAYNKEAHERCVAVNNIIVLMDEMIIVATERENTSLDVERVKQLPEFKALDDNSKAFWIVILTGIAGDDGESNRDQLMKFAQERLVPLVC